MTPFFNRGLSSPEVPKSKSTGDIFGSKEREFQRGNGVRQGLALPQIPLIFRGQLAEGSFLLPTLPLAFLTQFFLEEYSHTAFLRKPLAWKWVPSEENEGAVWEHDLAKGSVMS